MSELLGDICYGFIMVSVGIWLGYRWGVHEALERDG